MKMMTKTYTVSGHSFSCVHRATVVCGTLCELRLTLMRLGTSYAQNSVVYIGCQNQRVMRVEIMGTGSCPRRLAHAGS